jgi:YHS domain-containing protein
MEQERNQEPLEANEHLDPVCGMTVEEGPGAITYDYNNNTYYFCSNGCRRAFEKDPEKYLREGPSMKMG